MGLPLLNVFVKAGTSAQIGKFLGKAFLDINLMVRRQPRASSELIAELHADNNMQQRFPKEKNPVALSLNLGCSLDAAILGVLRQSQVAHTF